MPRKTNVERAIRVLRQGGGTIVNIASTRAFQSKPHTESYAAAKGGIMALTHSLAVSLGPDIRVNVIAPGWIDTGRWQKSERQREPKHSEEDKAEFITGQCFTVDGGMTKKMIYVE